MTRAFAPAVVLAVAAVLGAPDVAAAPVTIPGESAPPVLAALGALDAVEALGLSADGAVAVVSVPSPRSPGRSLLRVARHGLPVAEIELEGRTESLAMTAAGDAVFLVVRIVDKKNVVRRTSLERLDPATGRLAEIAQLPATSCGLALGAGDATLLVAAKDEIRSFVLPAMSSGPLYRVPGDNVAVAALSGSSRALVAQGSRIGLVDLAAPQDRDGLKIVDIVESVAAVRTMVAAPDEPSGLALLDDGRVVAIGVDPLRVADRATARAIAWPGVRVAAADPVAAPPVPPPPAPPPLRDEPPQSPPPTSAPVEAAARVPPPAAADPSLATVGGEPGSIRGTVGGPERGAVRAIAVLGPDNILRESARAVPDPSGRWTVSGLATGTYRIVAVGENGRVLICEPPYVTVRVGADGAVEAPALNAMRVY